MNPIAEQVLPPSDRTEAPEWDAELIRQVENYLAREGITQASAARQMGFDPSALNAWLKKTPKGNWRLLEQAAADFLKTAPLRRKLSVQKFETACVRKLRTAFLETKETNLVGVAVGPAGMGKTQAVEMLCIEFPSSVLITAYSMAGGAGAMLNRLWNQVSTRGWHSWRKDNPGGSKLDFIVERFEGSNRMIFIDNCHRLTAGGIEFWYDFWDRTKCPLFFTGNADFLRKLESVRDNDQQLSRTGTFWDLKMKEPVKMAEGIVTQLLPEKARFILPLAEKVAAGPGHGRAVLMQTNLCRRLMLGGATDAAQAFSDAGSMLLRRQA